MQLTPCQVAERISFSKRIIRNPCGVGKERFCWNATTNRGCNMYASVSRCHRLTSVGWMCYKTWPYPTDTAVPPRDSKDFKNQTPWAAKHLPGGAVPQLHNPLSPLLRKRIWAHAMHKYKFTGRIWVSQLFSSDLDQIRQFLFSSEDTSLLAENWRIHTLFLCQWTFF